MAARTRIATAIDTSGPFFARDPVRTFDRNARDFMEHVRDVGEQDVKEQLRQGEGRRAPLRGISPDRVSGHVVGRVAALSGKGWSRTAVVSVNGRGLSPRQAVGLMAAAAGIERRERIFRRTTSRVRRAARGAASDLLRGIG